MKRSEMVKLIQSYQKSLIERWPENPYKAANYLLCEIENAGMLPPFFEKTKKEYINNCITFDIELDPIKVNEWEPEA